MRTENEIKSLPLAEQQKLVIDLKSVPAGDKYYETAQRIIKFTEGLKTYKAPPAIEVTNIAGHEVSVDGKIISPGATAKVFPWQYLALSRFLEPTAPSEAKEIVADYVRNEKKESAGLVPGQVDIIVGAIKEGFAGLKKAAAVLLFVALMLGAWSATAQTQTYLIGSPSVYNVRAIGGYAGGSANVIITTNLLTPITNTVSIITNANWTVVNGVATNQVTYTTNTLVNIPGLVSIANYDGCTLMYSGQMMAGTTNVNSNVTVDYSPDMLNWQTNKWTLPITMAGTSQGTTNLDLSFTYGGFLRFNTITMAANVPETNVFLEVSVKPYRTGP